MQQILLIEDQLDLQLTVKALLEHRYRLVLASTGAEALAIAQASEVDLILLDVVLPDANGFSLCAKLRALNKVKSVPIVFLTSKGEITDRVTGFSVGADDYIVKPFEPLEFRARIEAKLQARLTGKISAETIRKGSLELDRAMFKGYRLSINGKRTDLGLTPHEYRLLAYFTSHEGHVISRDQLLTAVWGENIQVLERTIDRHIASLRKKLDPASERLEAVYGQGYQFSLTESARAA